MYTFWNEHTLECKRLQGDCSQCYIPKLIETQLVVPEGRRCFTWEEIKTYEAMPPRNQSALYRPNLSLQKASNEVLLKFIAEHPGAVAKDLAEATGMSRENAGFRMRILEQKGLLRSEKVKQDRVTYKNYYIKNSPYIQ